MQQNVRTECPKCSRPLQKFNGHIGYCSQHKWVSPSGLGFDAEAAEQNRQDAAAEDKRRLDAEREKAEAQAQEIRERHQSAVRKAIVVVIALCLITAAVVVFIVRPSVNYNNATNRFVAGEYAAARDGFMALGGYKDSSARVLLCDAMIDLQEGRPEDAVMKLDQLTSDGQGDIAKQLADALLPVVERWDEKGLTPQALLLLLSKAGIIDPAGTLDVAALKAEGHTALLDGTQLSAYAEDVNNDNEPELIVLNSDYSVTVYRMTADGNVRIAVDNPTAAACGMTFGHSYKETNPDASFACFNEAYRLLPNDETRAALTDAYRVRSASYANAGDMEAAIREARNAMETSGLAEDFVLFYNFSLRNCKNGNDTVTAIAMWDDFAASSAAELTRYSAKERWQNDAAQLHIAYAAELAAKKDSGCITELKIAAELGADVTKAISEDASHFEPGLVLAELRLMEIEYANGEEAKQQIRSNMANEVRAAISEWKIRGIHPADIPVLIYFADTHGIDLTDINRESIYEDAALASAGNITQHTFVNWNGDAYQELLTLDAEGLLSLYGIYETWHVMSSINTKLPGGTYSIADETAPLILVLSADHDELLAVTGTSDRFINKTDVIDPHGTLDIAALKVEGHMALLDGMQLTAYAEDVNNDSEPEFIVLNSDYSVTVYRMTADGNVRIAVDNPTAAACGMRFGNSYKETNLDSAVACFSEAYRLLPNDETRSALTDAYRMRSAVYENAGNMDAAMADARSAMDTSGDAEEFTFFYDINLRYCKNGNDAATAIAM